MKTSLYILVLIGLLTGCGQFGPLYLPNDPNPPVHVEKPKPETTNTTTKTTSESEKN